MNRVVVTGIGSVSPVGNNIKTIWESLVAGKCGIGFITKFDTTASKVKIAAEVKNFDPSLYMDKSDIRHMDPYTQYAVAAAAQAIEDSDITGKVKQERMGVYIGSGIGGMDTYIRECNKLAEKGPHRVSPFFIPMTILNMAAGMVAIRFQAKGPSMCVTTACATSANSVGEAFRAIKFGYADAMIAGGAEASINELAIAGFANCMALTTEPDPLKACTPFDKRRSGFVMGEGSAMLILEELEHAKKRGAKIYAEVCGYGNTNDAYHMTAPQPEAEGASEAVRLAVKEAEIEQGTKIYINAHGTSTHLNDKAETFAFKKALGEEWAHAALISSTKSMTGHMLGATGAFEAISAILAMKYGIIPPTIGYEVPDEECDLNYVPNTAQKTQVNVALSTNIGFGGHNACLAFRKWEG